MDGFNHEHWKQELKRVKDAMETLRTTRWYIKENARIIRNDRSHDSLKVGYGGTPGDSEEVCSKVSETLEKSWKQWGRKCGTASAFG